MLSGKKYAKVNIKVLTILILVTAAVVVSLFAARQIRRNIFTKMFLEAGRKAYENRDWSVASENFKEYLDRNQDDVEILKMYAEARLSIRPLNPDNIAGAISAYRRIIQLDSRDENAYKKLAILYTGTENYEELAYIARKKLEVFPNDRKAPLWLAEALIKLNRNDEAEQVLSKLINDIEAQSEKYPQYTEACFYMSNIIASRGSIAATAVEALAYLNKAVNYNTQSAEALVNRAAFYCQKASRLDMSLSKRLSYARMDLDAADEIGTRNPQTLFLAGSQWLELDELDKAAAELKKVKELPREIIEEYYFDPNVSTVAEFLLGGDILLRKGEIDQAASLADKTLGILTEQRNRVQVLPAAVRIYVTAKRITDARAYLNEYLAVVHKFPETQTSSLNRSYLEALVALAEGNPYQTIDILEPVTVNQDSVPELWRLLANAYSQTTQPGRAVKTIIKYLSFYPNDEQMNLQLAKEYFAWKDWENTFTSAQKAESLNPDDNQAKLIRIEAEIHLACEGPESVDKAKLEKLSEELRALRQSHSRDVNIRMLQAAIAINLKQSGTAEKELKLAITECEEPLIAEIRLAKYYYQTGRTAEAVSTYNSACERHPDVADPWIGLSEVYDAQKDYDSERKCLEKGLASITEGRQKRRLSVKLALLDIAEGNRTQGIQTLKGLAAQDEKDIQTRLLLLSIPEVCENQSEAGKLIDELKKIEGQTGLYWRLQEASLLLSSADWLAKQQQITDLLQYCIDSDPRWSAPVLLLARMYQKSGDDRKLEETCQQAIDRNPSAGNVADILLALLEKQGRFEDAEKVLTKVKTSWQVSNAWQVRAAVGAGDISRAINELELRISNDKQDAAARVQLARLTYQQTRDANEAFAYLNQAEAINPDLPSLTVAKASIMKAEGQEQEAFEVINDYVADHNDFNAYWMRALFLAGEGKYEDAEKDYIKLTTFSQAGAGSFGLLCNFYLARGNSEKALAAIEDGIEKYPDNLNLQRAFMKLLFSPGPVQDRPRALTILKSLQEKLPDDTEIMKYEAAKLMEKPSLQSYQSAKQKLEDIIKLDPTAVDVHLWLIDMAMQEQDYRAARDLAVRALGSNQDSPDLMASRAKAELALGDTKLAVELSRTVLSQDISNAAAMEVALQSKDQSLLAEARKMTETALNANPEDERLLLSRAKILVALGKPQEAVAKLESYSKTDAGSRSISVLVELAELYRSTGDMNKAEDYIEQAEQIEPDNLSVIHARFVWLVAQRRYDELGKVTSAYLSAKEQNSAILVSDASVLTTLGSKELTNDALKLFEKAASLSPGMLDAQFGLASCLYRTGNIERAIQVYKQLNKEHPDNTRVINDLAWIIQQQNQDYQAALDLVNRGLKLAPDDVHMLDTRGTILLKMNRLTESRNDFERLLELTPSNKQKEARTLLQLGKICSQLKDSVNAQNYLNKALEIDKKINVLTERERSEIEILLKAE
ncbi:MAG: tetratricopeptide repeat protein [Sedimentisphaerales bacterium]